MKSLKNEIRTEWMQPNQIGKRFGMSRATIYRVLEKMRASKFADGVLDLNAKMHLVNVDMFLAFLRSQDKQYLKKPVPPQAEAEAVGA